MEDFYQIRGDSCCNSRTPCFEGLCDIREGLRDIRRGIRDLDRGLDEIRRCHVRDGVHDCRDGMRGVTEGVNDILEGLTDLGIDKECRDYCEIQKDIRQIIEGLADIEDGIRDVEQRDRCECEHVHVCERYNGNTRERRLLEKENRRFREGIGDIAEGIRDIEMGFNDLADDLKELFFIADEHIKVNIRPPVHCGNASNRCRDNVRPAQEVHPFRRIRTIYIP